MSNKITDRFETEAACGVPKGATTIARIFAADLLQMQQTAPADSTKAVRASRSLRGKGRLAALDLQTGRLLLARPHLGIDAAAGKELAMVAALDDAAGFND